MCKCKIQWIDRGTGQPTPDDNEAVGVAIHTSLNANGTVREVKAFPICAEHKLQLKEGQIFFRGEAVGRWDFSPFPMSDAAIVAAIRRVLWLDDATDQWDADKEWDSETIEIVARLLTSNGRGPDKDAA